MTARRRTTHAHVDDPVSVGRRIREARERAGLSLRALSFPGCTPGYISRIERGQRVPSLQLLREFARRLRVSEGFLATGLADAELAPARLLEAELALGLGDEQVAEELFEALIGEPAPEAERARALAGLGQLSFRRGEVSAAIELLERARSLSPELEEREPAIADVLGRAYAAAEQFEAAIALFERRLALAEERQDSFERVRFSALLANALIDSGNFARAEEVLGHVLAAAAEISDPLARARLLWSQSRLRTLQGDADAAARYARQALETVKLTDHAYYAALAHQLLAHIEVDRGNAAEALALVEGAMPLMEQSGSALEQALLRLEEARALAKLGRREEAAALATDCSHVLRQASPSDAGRSYALVTELRSELGDEAGAIELYELAAEALEKVPTRYQVEVYSRLAELLERAGRTAEAFQVLKRAVAAQSRAGRRMILSSRDE